MKEKSRQKGGETAQDKPVRSEQWLGLVERGRPASLILESLNPPRTASHAPGPGAIRKVEWHPIAKKHLKKRAVIFHTDSAKSYKQRVEGVLTKLCERRSA